MSEQKRIAFLMGANGPQNQQTITHLKYAEKDVKLLAEAFQEDSSAFEVAEWLIAADPRATLKRLQDVANLCEFDDIFVAHFSGHAIYDEQLYLICNETDVDSLIASAIDIRSVKDILRRCKASYKLLVLDCCHAGAAHPGGFKSLQRIENILRDNLQGSASAILSACSRHQRTRELDSLDGGAGFLSWVLRSSCTARFKEVSSDGFSLSLSDIRKWLPMALREVNAGLSGGEPIPSPILWSEVEGGGEIWLTPQRQQAFQRTEKDKSQSNKEIRLKAMVIDHSRFSKSRLGFFVGRASELETVNRKIDNLLPTGGYLTITSQAGEGKSSFIAKLIDKYSPDVVAHHFIPLNASPDYQVSILRDIMARLILKQDLSDLYVNSENRAVLKEYFTKLLADIAGKGGKEVIFIDGIDQLKEEADGERDLTFLPINPPEGVVFVLGTRPNDTLKSLKLLKPHEEYSLPSLSRRDFDLLLEKHKVSLGKESADQFFEAAQKNALYLDLVARELAEGEISASPAELIRHLSDDPNNLFSFSIARFKKHTLQWREVIKPALGLLLASEEPFYIGHMRQILNIDDDQLRDGLTRLGGLIVEDGQSCYSLFHLKLQEYLRQDDTKPHKEYVFASDEEENWHKILAEWCEKSGTHNIWEDVKRNAAEHRRREYALKHCAAHLYRSHSRTRLFDLLDSEIYIQAKVQYDPSTRSYAQDLDLGRSATLWGEETINEEIALLPYLWRYTLLRCSIASRANTYDPELFHTLVSLDRRQEAIGLAELLTDAFYKATILLHIARQLRQQQNQNQEIVRAVERAIEEIEGAEEKAQTLCELGIELSHAQQWESAEHVWNEANDLIYTTNNVWSKGAMVQRFVNALIKAERWEYARTVIYTIEEAPLRIKLLCNLGIVLSERGLREWTKRIWVETCSEIDVLEKNLEETIILEVSDSELTNIQLDEHAKNVFGEKRTSPNTIDENEAEILGFTSILHWIEANEALTQAQEQTAREEKEKERNISQDVEKSSLAGMEGIEELLSSRPREEEEDIISALLDHCLALVEARQWDLADILIKIVNTNSNRAAIAFTLATTLIQAQQWNRSKAIIDAISDDKTRIVTLIEFGLGLTKTGLYVQAEETWKEVLSLAHSIEDILFQIEILLDLGSALADLGQNGLAEKIWDEALALAGTIGNTWGKIRLLLRLSSIFVNVGLRMRAEEIWIEVHSLISAIDISDDGSESRAVALVNLSSDLAKAHQWEQAEKVISAIKSRWAKATAQSDLATELTRSQQWERAQNVIDNIESTWNWIAVPAIQKLSMDLARAQQWEKSKTLITSIKGGAERAEALCELGLALFRSQMSEQAMATWAEADAEARLLEDKSSKITILLKLGSVLARTDQWKKAQFLFDEIECEIMEVGDTIDSIDILKEFGTVLEETGQYERLLALIQGSWMRASTKSHTIKLLSLSAGLVPLKPQIAIDFYEAFSKVEEHLQNLFAQVDQLRKYTTSVQFESESV